MKRTETVLLMALILLLASIVVDYRFQHRSGTLTRTNTSLENFGRYYAELKRRFDHPSTNRERFIRMIDITAPNAGKVIKEIRSKKGSVTFKKLKASALDTFMNNLFSSTMIVDELTISKENNRTVSLRCKVSF